MNFFYNTMYGTHSILMLTAEQSTITQTNQNGDVLFFNEQQKLIGFNVFLKQPLPEQSPGRLLLTPALAAILKKHIPASAALWTPEFVVGEITQCDPIVDTHLTTCIVDIKTTKLQIVCGAANVKLGLKTVVAKVGSIFANGLVIQPTKLKGVDSNGMLCSQRELGIHGFNETGIIELPSNYPIGETFLAAYANSKAL